MPDWTICPHCSLKHSRRADGTCPRCKQPVAGAASLQAEAPLPQVYDGRAVPGSRFEREVAAARSDTGGSELPTGARIAGGILLLNAIALLAERILMPSEAKGLASNPVSMGLDLIIGGMLLAGARKLLILAKIRTVLGGLVLPAVHIAAGNPFVAGLQVVFSTGLLLLLFGNAGKIRIGLGVAAAGLCLGLEAMGLQSQVSGNLNPLSRFLLAGQLDKAPASVVEGDKFRYRLTSPNDKWFLRKAELAKKENPLADRWLVRPDKDAHVFVIAEEVPGAGSVDMDRFAKVVMDNARKGAKEVQLVEETRLLHRLPARLLHTRSTIEGMELEGYYGLFIRDRCIFQVVAFTRKKQFGGLASELLDLIKSFDST